MFLFFYLTTVLSFCFYSWTHLHLAFWRRAALPSALAAALMLCLTLLPLWHRLIFGKNEVPWLVFLGWLWLALLFWFCSSQLLVDLWNLLAYLIKLSAGSKLPQLTLTLKQGAWGGIAFVLLASLWGIFEVKSLHLKKVEVRSENITPELDGYRIALLSDLHFRVGFQDIILHKTLNLLEEAKPQLLLSAGDFLDGKINDTILEHLGWLAKIECGDGKFAVLGNHDCYSGIDNSNTAHNKAGFRLLRQEGIEPQPGLWLYGVDDPAADGAFGFDKKPPLLQTANTDNFNILLQHQPIYLREAEQQGFNLALTGHTHGGQIFPFNYLVRLTHPYKCGVLQQLSENFWHYNSPGTGFWGPPFRLLSRPEVTLIILKHG
ncbi:MAG: hypothetical protein GX946_00290 [Oligosphaeraceae bacterium]|nr:hypothetical protein [Oligosphaeraceae bacterium]